MNITNISQFWKSLRKLEFVLHLIYYFVVVVLYTAMCWGYYFLCSIDSSGFENTTFSTRGELDVVCTTVSWSNYFYDVGVAVRVEGMKPDERCCSGYNIVCF